MEPIKLTNKNKERIVTLLNNRQLIDSQITETIRVILDSLEIDYSQLNVSLDEKVDNIILTDASSSVLPADKESSQ
jgi:hypothetical protein